MRAGSRRSVALAFALAMSLAASIAGARAKEADLSYPQTRREDRIEVLHGEAVADPYRWLEQDPRAAPEVRAWIDAQNSVTRAFLDDIPARAAIERRLTELWDYERFSNPKRVGGRYYYFRNGGLQNQSVLYSQVGLDGERQVVLDPNAWSEDGAVALAGHSFSDDGRHLAYAKATAGSDWTEWFVRDLATGRDLPDRLRWIKFSDVAWTKDGRGFFYSRFDAPPPGEEFKALNRNQKVFYHRLGTDQDDDILVYERPDQPDWGFAAQVSDDGRYLVINVWKGTDPGTRVVVRDLLEPYAAPVEVVAHFDDAYGFLGNDGPILYFRTDREAPLGRVIAMDLRRPAPQGWREVLPQAESTLEGAGIVGDLLVASYLEHAVTKVRLYRLDGSHVRDVALPGKGSAEGFEGRRSEVETFYTYSSFDTPSTVYRYDMLTGESRPWRRPAVAFDPARYVVKQEFYTSKDGTRVPIFLAHRRDVKLDGDRPTVLYGYGGFNVSLTPSFSVIRLVWMEMGGVWAMANLRGGGEYGEAWHDAGRLTVKQNTFDDFIAAAEWLVAKRYTRRERLAIMGGSNGGLLVGACMTQRPELFGAALPAVGVMDMLRFHLFTAGRYWVDDYGSPDDPQAFRTLRAYSPYHNLRPGTAYPATLVTTADTDDRVIPAHSFKFAAALQAAQAGPAPVLIRIETRAGHGAGKPTAKAIEEYADVWAFLVHALRFEPMGR